MHNIQKKLNKITKQRKDEQISSTICVSLPIATMEYVYKREIFVELDVIIADPMQTVLVQKGARETKTELPCNRAGFPCREELQVRAGVCRGEGGEI